eukprot:Hpha_TRINITY_DN15871_c1_g23::TRINITY_DN15871_c1_g23_i1::g.187835::m.187835
MGDSPGLSPTQGGSPRSPLGARLSDTYGTVSQLEKSVRNTASGFQERLDSLASRLGTFAEQSADSTSLWLWELAQEGHGLAGEAVSAFGKLEKRVQDARSLVHKQQSLVSRGLVGDVPDDLRPELDAALRRIRELEERGEQFRMDAEHERRHLESERLQALAAAEDARSNPQEVNELRRQLQDAEAKVREAEKKAGERQRHMENAQKRVESFMVELHKYVDAPAAKEEDQSMLSIHLEQLGSLGPSLVALQRMQRALRQLQQSGSNMDESLARRIEDACFDVFGDDYASEEEAGGSLPERVTDAIRRLERWTGAVTRNLSKSVSRVEDTLERSGLSSTSGFTPGVRKEERTLSDIVAILGQDGGLLEKVRGAIGSAKAREEQWERRWAGALELVRHIEGLSGEGSEGDGEEVEFELLLRRVHSRMEDLLQSNASATEDRQGIEEAKREVGSVNGLLQELLREGGESDDGLDAQSKALRVHKVFADMKSALGKAQQAMADSAASFRRIAESNAGGDSEKGMDPERLSSLALSAERAAERLRTRAESKRRAPPPPPSIGSPRSPLATELSRTAEAAQEAVQALPAVRSPDKTPRRTRAENAELKAKLSSYRRLVKQIQDMAPPGWEGRTSSGSASLSESSQGSPGDLERLAGRLVGAGQGGYDAADSRLDEATDLLMGLLPTAEALSGTPPAWEQLGDGEAFGAAQRFNAALERWRHVRQYFEETSRAGVRVMPTVSHQVRQCSSELRAALSRAGVPVGDRPAVPIAAQTDEDAVSTLDTVTQAACQCIDRLQREHATLRGAFETLCSEAGSPPRGSKDSVRRAKGAAGLVEHAHQAVLDLREHASGLEVKLTQLTRAAMHATQDLDALHGGSVARRTGADCTPEHALLSSVEKLKDRLQNRSAHGTFNTSNLSVRTGGGPDLSPEAIEKLSQLVPGTRGGDVIDDIKQRLDALNQDRTIARKENEGVRRLWRELSDAVEVRLRPLLAMLPHGKDKGRGSPQRGVGDDTGSTEGMGAAEVVKEVEKRVNVLQKQLYRVTKERDGQRYRCVDLEQQRKALQKQHSLAETELRSACDRAGLATVPTAQSGKEGIDVGETARAVADRLVELADRTALSESAERGAMRDREQAQRELQRMAKKEMERVYLRNAVRETLVKMRLMPDITNRPGEPSEDAEWSAICGGFVLLADEVARAVHTESRLGFCEGLVSKLLTGLGAAGVGGGEENAPVSPSPLPPERRLQSVSTDEPSCRLSPSAPLISPQRTRLQPQRGDGSPMSSPRQGSPRQSPRGSPRGSPRRGPGSPQRSPARGSPARGSPRQRRLRGPNRPSPPPPPEAALEARCEAVLRSFQRLHAAAEHGRVSSENLRTFVNMLRKLIGPEAMNSSPGLELVQGALILEDNVDSLITATERWARDMRRALTNSQEAGARTTAEKAKLVHDVCEMKREVGELKGLEAKVEGLTAENSQLREELYRLDGEARRLERHAEASEGLAQFAREIVESAAPEGAASPSPGEDERELARKATQAVEALRNEVIDARHGVSGLEAKVRHVAEVLEDLEGLTHGERTADLTTTESGLGAVYPLLKAVCNSVKTLADAVFEGRELAGKVTNYLRAAATTFAAPDSSTEPSGAEVPTLVGQLAALEEVAGSLLRAAHAHREAKPKHDNVAVSPRRAPTPASAPGGESVREAVEVAMELLDNLLGGERPAWDESEYLPGSPVASPTRRVRSTAAIAARCAALSGAVDAELRLMCQAPPQRGVLATLRAEQEMVRSMQQMSPRRTGESASAELANVTQGVQAVVKQIMALASVVSSSPPNEVSVKLMQAAKKRKMPQGGQECDPLGLVAAFRRLLAVVANKRSGADLGRDASEMRARAEDLKGEVTALTVRLQERDARLQRAEEGEKQAKSLLDLSRSQWMEQKKRLEESVNAVEGELRSAMQERDEAQSGMAISRHQINCLRRKHPRIAADIFAESGSPPASPRMTRSEKEDLERRLEQKEKECAEATEYAAKVYERLDSKEQKKKEYKERLRQAELELRALRDGREKERGTFNQQIAAVREEVLRMHSGGVAWEPLQRANTAPNIGSPRSDHASRPSEQQRRQLSWGDMKQEGNGDVSRGASTMSTKGYKPYSQHQDPGYRSSRFGSPSPRAAGKRSPRSGSQPALTVPVAPVFSASRGRTGCYCCDSPDGPTHYASGAGHTSPSHRCSVHTVRQSGSRSRAPRSTQRSGVGAFSSSCSSLGLDGALPM